MKPGRTLLLALALGAAGWLAWPDAPAPAGSGSAPRTDAAPPAHASTAWNWNAFGPLIERLPAAAAPDGSSAPVTAAQSMARARLEGDARAPPIAAAPPPGDAPTAQQLADPKAYLAFERAQTLKLYAAYEKAAAAEIPKLRADIERGRAAGIDQEKIAKAEAKLRGLEQIRARLLNDNPELAQ